MSYKKDINPCFKPNLIDKLSKKLWKLVIIYFNNFYYTQKPLE